MVPPDEKEVITIAAEDKEPALSEKKKKLKARTANKVGYRDLVMSTEGISLIIVENAKSEELTKGDLKKAWDRLELRWNPKTREDKVEGIDSNEGGIQKQEKIRWRCTPNS